MELLANHPSPPPPLISLSARLKNGKFSITYFPRTQGGMEGRRSDYFVSPALLIIIVATLLFSAQKRKQEQAQTEFCLLCNEAERVRHSSRERSRGLLVCGQDTRAEMRTACTCQHYFLAQGNRCEVCFVMEQARTRHVHN